ncbi:MAG: amidohydrolase family protein, partial [Blastopirellula sp. JB062]
MNKLARRDFLAWTAAGVSSSQLLADPLRAEAQSPNASRPAPSSWIDANVYLSRWPFRRLRYDAPGALTKMLRSQGVIQAWAGNFDAVFHKDIGAANRRLSEACAKEEDGILIPFGAVNPLAPQWKDELRLCVERYQMPGIRLHPNYHGYDLKDSRFHELLRRAADRNLIVQLVAWLEDPRTQHPRMRIATVDLAPLADLVADVPGLRIVLLNGLNRVSGQSQANLLKLPNVYCDIAQLETTEGIAKLLEVMPAERVLFGSYS